MNIELNKSEVELLDAALQVWEKETQSTALMGSMFSIMLCPKEFRDKEQEHNKIAMDKAELEAKKRQHKSLLLRAKLFQALSKYSEHDVAPI